MIKKIICSIIYDLVCWFDCVRFALWMLARWMKAFFCALCTLDVGLTVIDYPTSFWYTLRFTFAQVVLYLFFSRCHSILQIVLFDVA